MFHQYRHLSKPKNSILSKSFKVIAHVCRVLLGAVFIFSGFVKIIDPLGFTYKIEDYLTAFGPFFEQFSFFALPVSIILSSAELIIGLLLFFNIFTRQTSFFSLLFMCVMLPLTLYIALTDPVSDCGCFGDAIIISNWATFYKNTVLITLAIIVFLYRNNFQSILLKYVQRIVFSVFILISIALSVYCYLYLPIIDFRPYKIGVDIEEGMNIPEGEQGDVYETTLIYEKNGIQEEFTINDYPKNDSTWTFVDQKNTLISEGYEPPIHDFSIIDEYGDNILEDILYGNHSSILLIMYDLNKSSVKGAKRAEDLFKQTNVPFYALTGSSEEDIKKFVEETGVTYPFYFTDPTTLKTIVRSNPGMVFIKDKIIVDKKPWRRF